MEKRTEEKNGLEESRQDILRRALQYVSSAGKAGSMADCLLDAFGDVAGLFRAPSEEVARLKGISPEVPEYLQTIRDIALVYLDDKAQEMRRVYDTPSAVEIFRPRFLGLRTEAVGLMLLDGRGRVLYNRIITEGSITAVPVYIRRVAELCIRYDAHSALLAHNHPSGNAFPSRNDIAATREVEMALQSLDIVLEDHLILTENDLFSFADSGLMEQVHQSVRTFRLSNLQQAREKDKTFYTRKQNPDKEAKT